MKTTNKKVTQGKWLFKGSYNAFDGPRGNMVSENGEFIASNVKESDARLIIASVSKRVMFKK